MPLSKIRIGTRGSPLALYQANEVRRSLMAAHEFKEDQFEIRIFKTAGDKIQDKALRAFGGKGLFTKEIEDALLAKDIDIAVHSMKDMPTSYPDGLDISSMLPRADVRDAFLSPKASSIMELPEGAILGTSSLRRQAQVKKLRPDIQVVTYRGNVETRLRKLKEGVVDATLLAAAGLKRLEKADVITSYIDTDIMLPAVAQGAIGIESREDDLDMAEILAPINHQPTKLCIDIERAYLARLDGSCQTPIAGLAEISQDGKTVAFRGQILKPDGSKAHAGSSSAPITKTQSLGKELAEQLLSEAGGNFFNFKD